MFILRFMLTWFQTCTHSEVLGRLEAQCFWEKSVNQHGKETQSQASKFIQMVSLIEIRVHQDHILVMTTID
ncbi:hypothetical protein F5878DRAFT_243618 [Lentinula raphanica]|uniref:Secreted protein n=1 Tax=Lentinula raphanica TaxID=153919 RepID=A0AA38UG28_9AGAR|nr:hypothetical protein F5878DRAFT_243618 [Lentinula raphanica]